MAWILSGIAFICLVIAVSPHYSKNTNDISAYANAFLFIAQVFVFYFLCRIVSVDARRHMRSHVIWLFFDKILVPGALIYSLLGFIAYSLVTTISFCLGILILFDPLDTIGSAIRDKSDGHPTRLLAGIAAHDRDSFSDYLPALALIGVAYWILLY